MKTRIPLMFYFQLTAFVAVSLLSLTANAQCHVYKVGGGGTISSGSTGVTIALSGSQIGVNYQLRLQTTNVGEAISGTGSPLFWTIKSKGTYTVMANKSTAPTCALTMDGSASVAVTDK